MTAPLTIKLKSPKEFDGEPGVVYLIHFEKPFYHSQHYIGWSKSRKKLKWRLWHHAHGSGASIMRAVSEKGIAWEVVRTWNATRNFERYLKNRHGTRHFCPRCQSES